MAAMNKIQDKLFLGNIKSASDLKLLKQNNITHILQVASGIKPFFPNDIQYKVINVLDNSNQSLLRHFPAAIAFMKDAIQRGGGVLVHCFAGVSRSATCVIAYLMQEKEMTFEQAFSYASKRRPVIFPNMGFQRQLTEFERLLLVKKQYSVPKQINKQMMSRLNNGFQINAKQTYNSINTHALTSGNNSNTHANSLDNQILREVQAQIGKKNSAMSKPTIYNQTKGRWNEYAEDPVDDEDPFEYHRPSHFERSASFGFNQDKLGRLNEINREQVQAVLKGTHFANFRRTNSNFHRPMFAKQKQMNDTLSISKQKTDNIQKTPSIIHSKQQNLVMNPPPKNTGSLSKLDSQKSTRNRSYIRTTEQQELQNQSVNHHRTSLKMKEADPYMMRKSGINNMSNYYGGQKNVEINLLQTNNNFLPYRQQMDTIKNKYPQQIITSDRQYKNNYSYRPNQINPIDQNIPNSRADPFQQENRSLGLIPKISPKIVMVGSNYNPSASQSKLSKI